MATFPDEGRKNELVRVAGAGGVNLFVRLFVNPISLTNLTTLDDLIEASWTSYTPYNSALWSAPFIDVNGDAVLLSPVIVFTGPTALPGQTVYGWMVTIGTGVDADLWFLELLPTPQVMEFPTDQLPLRVQARLRYLAA